MKPQALVSSPTSLRTPVLAAVNALLTGDGRSARLLESVIFALIVFSVVSVGLEAMSGLPHWAVTVLHVTEIGTVLIFTVEYVLRILAAEDRLKFIFSFYGLVDLLSIAPFFLAGLDVRYLRSLRVLRVLRVLKLQRRVLEATVAERTRELADRNAQLERAQAQLKAELDVAKALQIAILPSAFPRLPGCDGAARMIPATTMGGDFYDFIELRDGRIGLVMADVSGKGVPAAFFMAVSRTNLRELAVRHSDPGDCLAEANDLLCMQNPMDLFVTVFYCIFDPVSGRLTYANGGHNPPFLRRADGSVELLSGRGGRVLGAMPGARFLAHSLDMTPGDRIVLFTDGVTEAFNLANEAYGAERLVAELRAHGDGTATMLVERICDSVTRFAGEAPQSDDITLTVLAWHSPAGP